MTPPAGAPDVAKVEAQLLGTSRVGAYQWLRLHAPQIAGGARPGHFVAVAVGGVTSGHLLRRCFSIHRVDVQLGTVELVVAAHGPGTVWLTELGAGARIDVVGPLGTCFPLPLEPVPCVLVGGGYGSAPLFWLAETLREHGCHTELVLGAADADRLFGVDQASASADAFEVTTDDGSAGTRGWVSDILPQVLARSRAAVVYACGPMAMLRSVTEQAQAAGAVAQVAVEEAMACGIGVCMTCVLPVIGQDGRTSMVRSCLDGPVFRGDLVRWDAFSDGYCHVPADAVGAPQTPATGGH